MAPRKAPESDDARWTRLWAEEHALLAQGARWIAGVDEAGRGPLAGPLVVAAVILPFGSRFAGLNDSKQVAPDVRERLYDEIIAASVAWAIEVISPDTIDELNILRATHHGMRAAVRALHPAPAIALIDGLPLPAPPLPQRNLVRGDARSASIAAASILAKVTRDRLMCALDGQYPGYGFARHKGYPTAEHLRQLRRLGPCPIHRRSYAPVQAAGQELLW